MGRQGFEGLPVEGSFAGAACRGVVPYTLNSMRACIRASPAAGAALVRNLLLRAARRLYGAAPAFA